MQGIKSLKLSKRRNYDIERYGKNKQKEERSLESKKELMDNKQDRIVIHKRKQGRVKE